MRLPSFISWLERVSRLPTRGERQMEADSFYFRCEASGTPIIEQTRVIFIYKGEAERVFLFGDMTEWTDKREFLRLEDTDFFYLEEEYEADARLQYWFLVDNSEIPLLDRLNPNRIGNGLGLMSELTMPKYEKDPVFSSFSAGEEGSFEGLTRHFIPSGELPYGHEIHIFEPETSKPGPYPSVYFQDGPDYLRFAHAPEVLQKLIDGGDIPPCIAIFVTPPNLHLNKIPNRSTEYGLNDSYIRFFCDELVPFIHERYPVKNDIHSRVVVGDSYGGLASTNIALSRPDMFLRVCSQSAYYSFNGNSLINRIRETDNPGILLFFHVGTYEKKVGANFIPPEEQNFTAANMLMKEVLDHQGWEYRFMLSREGHTWGNWRGHLSRAFSYLMGDMEAGE